MLILDKINEESVLSRQELLRNAFCTKHTGKMTSLASISTCCFLNDRCEKRRQNGNSICNHCFAATMAKCYKGLRDKLERNTELLTTIKFRAEDIPFVPNDLFRFESFGDLINDVQVWNYFLIAKQNPHARCALWTKNPDIIDAAMRKHHIKVPDNLVIVYSSPLLNKQDPIPYDFIDKVFTVYDKNYAKENGVEINCGAKSCRTCQQCYVRDGHVIINELLK